METQKREQVNDWLLPEVLYRRIPLTPCTLFWFAGEGECVACVDLCVSIYTHSSRAYVCLHTPSWLYWFSYVLHIYPGEYSTGRGRARGKWSAPLKTSHKTETTGERATQCILLKTGCSWAYCWHGWDCHTTSCCTTITFLYIRKEPPTVVLTFAITFRHLKNTISARNKVYEIPLHAKEYHG